MHPLADGKVQEHQVKKGIADAVKHKCKEHHHPNPGAEPLAEGFRVLQRFKRCTAVQHPEGEKVEQSEHKVEKCDLGRKLAENCRKYKICQRPAEINTE